MPMPRSGAAVGRQIMVSSHHLLDHDEAVLPVQFKAAHKLHRSGRHCGGHTAVRVTSQYGATGANEVLAVAITGTSLPLECVWHPQLRLFPRSPEGTFLVLLEACTYCRPSPDGVSLLILPHSSRREAEEAEANPGNNLYITGLSTRVTERDLEDHFAREAKVTEARLVVDPRTKESRGFGFVTVSTIDEAERCMKYLNRSILEGRVITVERPLYKSTNEVKVEAAAQSGKEKPVAAATTMAMGAVEGGPHGILHTAVAVIGIALHATLHIVGAGVIVLIPDPDHHGALDL
eukprot:SM000006S19445  [mRNA]  locus=s6:692462:694670:- [translate_table: standard]